MFTYLDSIEDIKQTLLKKLSSHGLTANILEHNSSWFIYPKGTIDTAIKQAESLVRLITEHKYPLIDALLLIKLTGALHALEAANEEDNLPRIVQNADPNQKALLETYLIAKLKFTPQKAAALLQQPTEDVWLLLCFLQENDIILRRKKLRFLMKLPAMVMLSWQQLMASQKDFTADSALLTAIILQPKQLEAFLASDLTAHDIKNLDAVKISALVRLKHHGITANHLFAIHNMRHDHIDVIALLSQTYPLEQAVTIVTACKALDVQMLKLGFKPEELATLNNMQKYALLILQHKGLRLEHFAVDDNNWFVSYDHILALDDILTQFPKIQTPASAIETIRHLTGEQAIWRARGLSREAVSLKLNEFQRIALLILATRGLTPQILIKHPWFNSDAHIAALVRLLYSMPENKRLHRKNVKEDDEEIENAYVDKHYLAMQKIDLNFEEIIPIHDVTPEEAVEELRGLDANALQAIQLGLRRKDVEQIGKELLNIFLKEEVPAHNFFKMNIWQQKGLLAYYYSVSHRDQVVFLSPGLKSKAHFTAFTYLFAKYNEQQHLNQSRSRHSPAQKAMTMVELMSEQQAKHFVSACEKKDDFVSELMLALQNYIERHALTKLDTDDEKINFAHGFTFFGQVPLLKKIAEIKADHRKINYKTAVHLLDELGKGKNIAKLFNKIHIDAFRRSLDTTWGIHSDELNNIITMAREHIAIENKIRVKI